MTTEAGEESQIVARLAERLQRESQHGSAGKDARRESRVELDDDLRVLMYCFGAFIAAATLAQRKLTLNTVAKFLDVPDLEREQVDKAVRKASSTEAGLAALFDTWQEKIPATRSLSTKGAAQRRAEERILELPMLDASEVSKFLGSRSANERQYAANRRRRGELLGLRRGNRYVYPKFQFDQARRCVYPVIEDVGKILDAERDPWGVVSWWISPNPRLPAQRAPIKLLDAPGAAKDLPALARSIVEDVG